MSLRALIFDVDGTLADTERDGHRLAFNAAFTSLGLDWHWDEALYGDLLKVAGGLERLHHYAQQRGGPPQLADDLNALLKRVHAEKTRHYVGLVASGKLTLRPGVARVIAEARTGGIRLAIATTTTHENVISLLKATLGPDAPDWFEVIGTAREVPAKKPDPAVYQWVLARLGMRASEALAIEDSRNGLLAALGAGLACIVTPTDYSRTEDFSGARACLKSLDEHPGRPGQSVGLADLADWCG